MIKRRQKTLETNIRLMKNKQTQLLILLQRCTQIPKDDRLKLREKIKSKDQQLFNIMDRFRKQSDLGFLQLELRRHIFISKKQNSQNKPTNLCSAIKSHRQPIQIKVQVIPRHNNTVKRLLNFQVQKQIQIDKRLMNNIDRNIALIENNNQKKYSNRRSQDVISSRKKSFQGFSSPPSNKTSIDIKQSNIYKIQVQEQNKILKQKANNWYQQFKAKYDNTHFESQYSTQKINEQKSKYQKQQIGHCDQSLQQSIIQKSEQEEFELQKCFKKPFSLNLNLVSLPKEQQTGDELFSFRRREQPQNKQTKQLSQSTAIYNKPLQTQSRLSQQTTCFRSPKNNKYGQFYKRLKEQLQIKD